MEPLLEFLAQAVVGYGEHAPQQSPRYGVALVGDGDGRLGEDDVVVIVEQLINHGGRHSVGDHVSNLA